MTQATYGQKLTPNPNVKAPAGIGGSLWGANGGGITPSQSPPSVLQKLSNGQRVANYDARLGVNTTSVLADLAKTQLSHQTVDVTADDNISDVTADSRSGTLTADSGL